MRLSNTPAMITKHDVLVVLGRVANAGYVPPGGISNAAMVDEWFDSMKAAGVTSLELDAALADFKASSATFWPKPGEFIEAIRRHRRSRGTLPAEGLQGEYNDWVRNGCLGPCPVCLAIFDNGRGAVPHSDKVHRQHGIAYSIRRTTL